MTNEEIIESTSGEYTCFSVWDAVDISKFMELARADEREKMQGVEVWVSWDNYHPSCHATVFSKEPISKPINGGKMHDISSGHCVQLTDGFAKWLGLRKGQCKKFKIMEATQ